MTAMPAALALALDLALALGACLRLTRFIVADDVPGGWWIKEPLNALAERRDQREREQGIDPFRGRRLVTIQETQEWQPRWRYMEGLSCPFCMSVWMAAVVAVSLLLAGGPGHAADWWRWIAGFLTLAWLTGHIAARAGDTED